MASKIRDVYSQILREIAEKEELGKSELIEALLEGNYSSGALNERGVEVYSPEEPSRDFGKILYRGPSKRQHAFYFIPQRDISKVIKTEILSAADSIGRKIPDLRVTLDHFPWPPLSEEEENVKNKQKELLKRVYKTARSPRGRKAEIVRIKKYNTVK